RLAPAATEIEVPPSTAAAWLAHPFVAAVGAEGARVFPDPRQAAVAHVVERERRDLRGRMARQHVAVGRYHDVQRAPPAVARLRELAVIVGQYVDDLHPALVLGCLAIGYFGAPIDLRAGGHERVTVGHRPSVVLGVGELDPVRA